MFLHTSPKKTNKFITYSQYGFQSHVIINSYGVPYTVNTKGTVYDSEIEAIAAKDNFFSQITEIQDILKIDSFITFEEVKQTIEKVA